MSLDFRNELIAVAILLLGAVITELLVHRRIHWRPLLLLMAAGVASGILSVVVHFGPTQRAMLPFRFEVLVEGGQSYGDQPHDAPLPLTWLARQGRLPPLSIESLNNRMGPGRLGDPALHDPNPVCALPNAGPVSGQASTDPTGEPDLSRFIVYRGWRAFVYYAFGNHVANAMQNGGFRCFYHGVICALVLLVCRRSRRGFSPGDRAWVLVVSAWLSIAWPALARYSHTLFHTVSLAWHFDVLYFGAGEPLPLALGDIGVGAIWAGAALAHILTIVAVIRWARARATAAGAESDATPSPAPRLPFRRGVGRGVRRAAPWVLVGVLLCGPLTLPLVGALIPAPVLDAIGRGLAGFDR